MPPEAHVINVCKGGAIHRIEPLLVEVHSLFLLIMIDFQISVSFNTFKLSPAML